ncbi:longitudinals lacking protein, isoforms A/B/D/L-like isoform X1 [Nilaparvata lugens]|uniref:longitudinals lacking protein, isoforms A/B/D/L-like isoform X1 n=1 Tax=Nilaparvata lugens TaxID=108931 RepID=UPI00193E41FA|nr:longitudinals lacking protein, isoforms A/B/D/L-like isoform X1 [Nilaparvata lugens]
MNNSSSMGTEQQFCLRWNNHQSTLISVFDSLLENSVLVDCTLAADGQQLKAHKVVLSACSPYLETILSQHHDKHPIIILKDVKFAELRAMLEYMYRGEVNISQEQLGNFLKAAETLQIKGLTDSGGRGVTGGNSSSSNGGGGVADYNKYKAQGQSAVMQTEYMPVDHHRRAAMYPREEGGSRAGGLMPDERKQGLVIPSHVVTDRAPQSPLAAREGSVSPTLRKRRKMSNYEPTNLRTTFPSSDTPDTTSAFPESLPPHAASQGSPSPPLSESASSAAAVPQDYGRQPSAVVKTEMCNDTTSENEDSVTGDDRSLNAGDDERSNAAPMPAAGPSTHFIPHGFGDKQHPLQDGSNDEFSPEDLHNSTQDLHDTMAKLAENTELLLFKRKLKPDLITLMGGGGPLPGGGDLDQENQPLLGGGSGGGKKQSHFLWDNRQDLTRRCFCPKCDKHYSCKSALNRHLKLECGKEPQFQCPECCRRYTQRSSLMAHFKKFHENAVSPFPFNLSQ